MADQDNTKVDIVQYVILLEFAQGGITPISCYPPKLDEGALNNIGVKFVSINVGEHDLSEGVSVIPFPQFKTTGLTYTFTVPTESTEVLSDAYFLALMIKEKNRKFIFQNIDHLIEKLEDTSKILKKKGLHGPDSDIEIMRLYNYFVEFSKKYLEIKELLQVEREKSILAAILLYFHRKAGPIVFTTYPRESPEGEKGQKELITEVQAKKLCKELEIATHEGFFTRSYPDMSHVSYYFEIPSEWARGKKEMLLLSYVFRKPPGKDITNALHLKAIEFVERMKVHPEIFKGFYDIYEIARYPEEDKKKAVKMKELLEQWIKKLYITSLDVFQSTPIESSEKKTIEEEV